MRDYGARMLRTYTKKPKVEYEKYYSFETEGLVNNYRIPPVGRTIRVTDLSGNPIILDRRKVQGGQFRCFLE